MHVREKDYKEKQHEHEKHNQEQIFNSLNFF